MSAISVRQFDALTVRIGPTTEAMAADAAAGVAQAIGRAVAERGEANAMFATGNSQLAMIEHLVERDAVDWSHVRVFHMDEYVGMTDDHPASFARYIRERIVERVKPMDACYVGNSVAGAAAYAELLQTYALDLCVMGIGENGHLAFNDPPVADFDDPLDVKVVQLDEGCRRQQVGEGHFPSIEAVPAEAVTVTIPALLRARSLVVVCPEARKAAAVAAALTGPISTACPASILRRAAHARLFLDAASAAGLPPA